MNVNDPITQGDFEKAGFSSRAWGCPRLTPAEVFRTFPTSSTNLSSSFGGGYASSPPNTKKDHEGSGGDFSLGMGEPVFDDRQGSFTPDDRQSLSPLKLGEGSPNAPRRSTGQSKT